MDNTPNLRQVWCALDILLKPLTDNGEVQELDQVFNTNVESAIKALGFPDVQSLPQYSAYTELTGTSQQWDFVLVVLYILQTLRRDLDGNDISVSQQKNIRICFQFVVTLGILPSLMPGVGLSLKLRSIHADKFVPDKVNDIQKYERLCIVIRFLTNCLGEKGIRGILVSNIMGDYLASLCQISYAPLKKPDNSSCTPGNFVMTEELYEKLKIDQKEFKIILCKFVDETYQPIVISHLMRLQGSDSPLWLKKGCSNMLTNCLIRSGGVASLIRAMLDSGPDIGADWGKIDIMAQLITSPRNHYKNICNQLVEILSMKNSEFTVIIVACIKSFIKKDPVACHQFVFNRLLQPILLCYNYNPVELKPGTIVVEEEQISHCVEVIHRAFSVSTSTSSVSSINLPVEILVPVVHFLFSAFCKVHGSASHLTAPVKELLHKILLDSDETKLKNILQVLLFGESFSEIQSFPRYLCFDFGSEGGVYVRVASHTDKEIAFSSVEEAGNNIIFLLQCKSEEDKISYAVFIALLKIIVDYGMNPKNSVPSEKLLGTVEDAISSLVKCSERRVGVVRLLAVLAENVYVQKQLAKSPKRVVDFLQTLLNSQSAVLSDTTSCNEENLECLFVALMLLGVILDKQEEEVDFHSFKSLLPPLNEIKNKSKNQELQRLSSAMYNTITTQGAVGLNSSSCDFNKKENECERALHDACDPLLPVRGHALVKLTKLLQNRDKDVICKKDVILCLFNENLKHEDSFIYLAAVNGIAAMAYLFPGASVKSLTEEYTSINSDKNPETLMKVGEILVKLTRSLGDFSSKYRDELLNAFLVGTRNTDHLMRASSLSNLGELCSILGFRIGPVLEELLLCLRAVINFDKAVEPRRAAVMVTTMLLRGLEKDALVVLQSAALELYRTLKFTYENDVDDVVKLHAQLALEEFSKIAKDFLCPVFPFEKLRMETLSLFEK